MQILRSLDSHLNISDLVFPPSHPTEAWDRFQLSSGEEGQITRGWRKEDVEAQAEDTRRRAAGVGEGSGRMQQSKITPLLARVP